MLNVIPTMSANALRFGERLSYEVTIFCAICSIIDILTVFGFSTVRLFLTLFYFRLEGRVSTEQHIVVPRFGLFKFESKFLIHTVSITRTVFIVKLRIITYNRFDSLIWVCSVFQCFGNIINKLLHEVLFLVTV